MVETKKLRIIKGAGGRFILSHTFIPDDDTRRHTDFYLCSSERSAEILMRCIGKTND